MTNHHAYALALAADAKRTLRVALNLITRLGVEMDALAMEKKQSTPVAAKGGAK